MTRRTWTDIPIAQVERRPVGGHFKPSGLWYEIDGEWVNWCRSEAPDYLAKGYHDVSLTDSARIAVLSTPLQVRAFNESYRIGDDPIGLEIDWARVACDFDGIEIQNYRTMWQLRYEPGLTWFYGWDCSSGCIWNPAAVQLSPYHPVRKERK